MPSVVVIEDDQRVRLALAKALEGFGHVVTATDTAMAGLQTVIAQHPDVIVLDLGLPDLDGRDLLRMMRPVTDAIVIVATARVAEEDIVATLDDGADDYITKPFSPEQLDARIRAALRRMGGRGENPEVSVGEIRINARTRVASHRDALLDLSRKEFDLLLFLCQNVNRVVSKREILAEVWRQPVFTTDKTVDVHVSWLRRKLGESADQPKYLHSYRGVGLKIVDPTQENR